LFLFSHAEIYLKGGTIVHAACGPLLGVAAVYAVIAWKEDGEFLAETVQSFPENTSSSPTMLFSSKAAGSSMRAPPHPRTCAEIRPPNSRSTIGP